MSTSISFIDLKRALTEGSGVPEGVDLDRDLESMTFSDLGYDSLAILETGLRLGRENNVEIEDDVFADLETPQQLIEQINAIISRKGVPS
jgi:minimal PKS acyl carrier protein